MPTDKFNVRPVYESDLNEWFRLRKLLWDENDDGDHRSEMMDILSHPESQLVLVADAGQGQLIGFLEASIRPFVEDCRTDHVGYLEGWFVESEHRKIGVGRELVRNAENWAGQKGCTEMASDAEVGNEESLNAHAKLGYEVTSKLVHLRKELPG
ncbi:MAG: GNAT family N-acetyltransferase [bacterium]|nr:GNAT family N-acetyltransferase [bacterium]